MRKLLKRIFTITTVALILSVLAIVSIRILQRNEPSGYVSSYSIYSHDPYDVLDFSNGFVTMRTCCGDETHGSYTRSSAGQWIWTNSIRPKDKEVVLDTYVMEPHAFSITFVNSTNSAQIFTLPRRFFVKLPF
jgi:hypothetical protein